MIGMIDYVALREQAREQLHARAQARTQDRDRAIRLFAGALRDFQQQRDADKIDQPAFQYVLHLEAIHLINRLDEIESSY